MESKTSQSPKANYTKRGYYVAIITLIGTFIGLVIGYFAWQYPKAPSVELQKLVSRQEAATPTPTSTPINPNPSPSATKPNRSIKRATPPAQIDGEDDGLCLLVDEEGNKQLDDNGDEIWVDCDESTDSEP